MSLFRSNLLGNFQAGGVKVSVAGVSATLLAKYTASCSGIHNSGRVNVI